MASYNRVTLMGNLTRDPELRFTQNGTPVANFGLAVNNPRSKDDDAVDFFDCTAWRGVGETITNYKHKGEPVLIEGRIEFQQYEDKQGNARSKHIIVVENVQFLYSPNGGSSNGASNGNGQAAGVGASAAADAGDEMDQDIPF